MWGWASIDVRKHFSQQAPLLTWNSSPVDLVPPPLSLWWWWPQLFTRENQKSMHELLKFIGNSILRFFWGKLIDHFAVKSITTAFYRHRNENQITSFRKHLIYLFVFVKKTISRRKHIWPSNLAIYTWAWFDLSSCFISLTFWMLDACFTKSAAYIDFSLHFNPSKVENASIRFFFPLA